MSDVLDRFQPPDEHDEPAAIEECAFCGDAINVGDDTVLVNDGNYIHDLCEIDYLRRFYVDKRGVINAERTLD